MDIVLRAAFFYCFLFVLLRTLGRRQLSSMEPFDILLLVVMGDFTQQAVTQSDMSLTGGVLAVGTIAMLGLLGAVLNFRFPRLRPVMDGSPLVLLADGELIEENLRSARITREDLLEQARLGQLAGLDDVRWAVLETSGQISFIPKR
jgi:uncharacterized membrane protein YcaP (DUF421 family)